MKISKMDEEVRNTEDILGLHVGDSKKSMDEKDYGEDCYFMGQSSSNEDGNQIIEEL